MSSGSGKFKVAYSGAGGTPGGNPASGEAGVSRPFSNRRKLRNQILSESYPSLPKRYGGEWHS